MGDLIVTVALVVIAAIALGAVVQIVKETADDRARCRREDARIERDLRVYEFQKRGR